MRQKALLGKYFDKLTYVQCDKTPGVCKEAGVVGVPAWDIRGQRVAGYQRFPSLFHSVSDLLHPAKE